MKPESFQLFKSCQFIGERFSYQHRYLMKNKTYLAMFSSKSSTIRVIRVSQFHDFQETIIVELTLCEEKELL